jgi:transposase
MRGESEQQLGFSVVRPDQLVPEGHPIRMIKRLADAELKRLSSVFDQMYPPMGRPSIPPEHLLKGCLLMCLYSIRSERQLCERLRYDMLFRYFLDLQVDGPTFDPSGFAHNRDRLLQADVARLFFEGILRQAKQAQLISKEHFTVDGTLIEAWASLKSFKPRSKDKDDDGPSDGGSNPTLDFRGEKRSNETHESTTDPEAKLARKGDGKSAVLSYSAHLLMENRNGLCVDVGVGAADGFAERHHALRMLRRLRRRGFKPRTVGADKGYDTKDFVGAVRALSITPHIAPKDQVRSGPQIDRRTTRHPGFWVSQRVRKRVEEIFGWMKVVGGLRKLRYRGTPKVRLWTYFSASAYNLVRMTRLLAPA